MMISGPEIETRPEQPYIGIRMRTPMQDMPTVIPQLLGEVIAWLNGQGIAPVGAPFCAIMSSIWRSS